MSFIIYTPLPPKPWARTGGKGAARFTPKAVKDWQKAFRGYAAQILPPEPLEGELQVDVLAVFERPKKRLRNKDADGLLWKPSVPDQDNLRKNVLDALKPFWTDDAIVVSGATWKVYAEKGQTTRTVVWIGRPPVRPEEIARVSMLAGRSASERRADA